MALQTQNKNMLAMIGEQVDQISTAEPISNQEKYLKKIIQILGNTQKKLDATQLCQVKEFMSSQKRSKSRSCRHETKKSIEERVAIRMKDVKRPRSPFILFSMCRRYALHKTNPTAPCTQISAMLGEEWRHYLPHQKQTFVQMSTDEQEAYARIKAHIQAEEANRSHRGVAHVLSDEKMLENVNAHRASVGKPALEAVEIEESPATPVRLPNEIVRQFGRESIHNGKRVIAYHEFCNDERENIKAEFPDMNAKDVTRELGRRWREVGYGSDSDCSYTEIDDMGGAS